MSDPKRKVGTVMISRRVVFVVALIALASGCSSTDLATDYDPEFNFGSLRTYRWAERTVSKDDDPRVYNDLLISRINDAIDRALQTKGYQHIESGTADFLVGWHGSIDKKMNVQTVTDDYGYGMGLHGPSANAPGPTTKTYVNEWEEGTLIIDIVDAGSNDLVWRGAGTGLVEETPGSNPNRLNEFVTKIFSKFPPK